MTLQLDYFIPNRDLPSYKLLDGFLSSPPASVAEKYVDALTTPGDLIVDPFAATPMLAHLALKMERRAILFESNPLWAWVAQALATIPQAAEINSFLARLGDILKDDTSLRAHIARLYDTRCAVCNQLTPVEYFIHQRDVGPIFRRYTCINCGAVGDGPATPDDIERFKSFDARGMHYHLAFERVVPEDNLWANRIRNLLDLYTPRNLYALVTLTLKGESLTRTPSEMQILNLMLLHLLDRGASLYASPNEPARLARHKKFIEFNLWHEAEIAMFELAQTAALELSDSPRLVAEVESPSVWMGRASAKKIAEEIPPTSVALVLASLPTRRAAFGALSYFWGAWILKRATVQTLVPFLDPQTADPAWERRWYLESLAATMNALSKILQPDAHAIFIFAESNNETIEALLLATAGANLNLENFVFQPSLGEAPRRIYDGVRSSYRIGFVVPHPSAGADSRLDKSEWNTSEIQEQIRRASLEAAREILKHRGEPLAFPWLHHAAYRRAANEGLFHAAMHTEMKTAPGRFVFQAVQEGLTEGYAHDFDHYAGLWLMRGKTEPPLIDRVEKEIRDIKEEQDISNEELENRIYEKFSGDLTPEDGLIDLCIRACVKENPAEEKSHVEKLIRELGERFGYAVAPEVKPFDWVWKEGSETAHIFAWRAHPGFSDLARIHIAPARGYLIVPESQVELLREKVRRLPLLTETYREAGWDFVRVPSLEKLLKKETLERYDLVLMTGLVPMVAEPSAQLELL